MYDDKFKQATKSLMSYCREQMGYDKDPDVHFVTDNSNANNMLGYTAHYQPESKIVTIYISNRHPKDALRSLSHELVHHAQNCRGDLQSAKTEEGYAQKDPHMRKMEEEAYLQGNMMFRDWEDSCKEQNMILPSTIGEQKMSNLKNLIKEKIMAGLMAEKKMPMKTDTEDLDGDGKTTDKIPTFVNKKQKKGKGKIPPQFAKKGDEGKEKEDLDEKFAGSEYETPEGKKARKEKEKERRADKERSARLKHSPTGPSHDDEYAMMHAYRMGDVKEEKELVQNELTDIKKNQDSINSLNENRLLNINKELLRRLLK